MFGSIRSDCDLWPQKMYHFLSSWLINKNRTSLWIGGWNIRILLDGNSTEMQEGKQTSLLRSYKTDIAALREIRFAYEGMLKETAGDYISLARKSWESGQNTRNRACFQKYSDEIHWRHPRMNRRMFYNITLLSGQVTPSKNLLTVMHKENNLFYW